jgi:redox-sensitive bicupin YhaK (pirin superfamily)
MLARGKLTFPIPTRDPFLFGVYHLDVFPPGNEKMQVPNKIGNGSDFDQEAPYRMYHGKRIPGFPQHPHRGFETITCTIQGLIDHTDSLGTAGRYGNGDLNWTTTGKGIVHGENFPLINQKENNTCRFFQLWLNLPRKSKLVEPAIQMHWLEEIPVYKSKDGNARVTVWAGEFHGVQPLPPPKDSWANDPKHDVGVWFIELEQNGTIELPPSLVGTNRSLYFITGQEILVNNESLPVKHFAHIKDNQKIHIVNSGSSLVEILVLQGQPINEPIAQHGPFVMNSREEIFQAFQEYQTTGFGGWPWDEDAVVFPASEGRFLLQGKKKILPPVSNTA